MTGADNEVWPQKVLYPFDILLDIIRGAVYQKILRVDTSHEGNLSFELGRKCVGIHAEGSCLKRVQAIDPGIN